jgi:hypothetical protein
MTSKLRAIRAGHRSTITRLLKKLEEENSEEIAEREDLELILETLEAKHTILKDLDEKILADTLEEDTEKEILDTDEYNFTLHAKLRKFRKHILVQRLALEPTAESDSNPTSQRK